MKMSVDEFRRRLQELSDEQLEQFLLRMSGQAPTPEKKRVQPPPAQGILPKEILEEMAAMRKAMKLRPSGLDTEHMKWLRTCERLQELPMGDSAFCGDGDREIYDNFVGCRIDLSHSPVFMACNDLDAVAKPLRDRCTVIRFPEVELPRLYQMMERYCAGREERYHNRVTMETAVIRQLCEKLYPKGIRSIRQHQRLLDSVMEDAYIKALEGGEPIVTADSAAWAVDKVAGGNPHRAGF